MNQTLMVIYILMLSTTNLQGIYIKTHYEKLSIDFKIFHQNKLVLACYNTFEQGLV